MQLKLPLLLLFILLSTHARGIQFISTNLVDIAKSETINDEQWIYTIDAEVNGIVKDDLFILSGNRINLGGTFERNIWGIGTLVNLTGEVQHNVRLIGKTVQIGGHINGNILALADTLKITPKATIQGDMKLMGNNVILEGSTQGNVTITASRVVTISGIIDGDLNIIAPEIILQRNTRIGGDLTYTAGKELVPAEGLISGQLKRTLPPSSSAFSKDQLISQLMWFLAALLAGIPFITLFPITTAISSQLIRTMPWKCLWVGAVATLILPVFGILCISSIISIPLGALLLGGWGFMAYISRIIMGLVIGTLVLRSDNTSINRVLRAMAVGLAIIYTAFAIPAISWSMQILVISMGTGSLLIGLFQKRQLIIQGPKKLNPLEELSNQETTNQEE